MAEKLKEPRKKWRSGQRAGCPLPVLVESFTGIPAHLAVWKTYRGRFTGDSVEVHDPGDVAALYNMGCFGKGSLSRSCPRSARKTVFPEIIRERQWKKRLEWEKQHKDLHCAEDSLQHPAANIENFPCSSGEETIVRNSQRQSENLTESTDFSSDSDIIVIADKVPHCEDFISKLNPRLYKNPETSKEALLLSLEESVFLNYGLGCLSVQDVFGVQDLSSTELWALCQESNPRFVERYVVYHYFRSLNWVVKSGLKFGGDFMLYKEGPGYYHASYIVLAKLIHEDQGNESSETDMSWTTLMGLNRLAEASGKEILICYVLWPSSVQYGLIPSPNVIPKFKVHEVLVRRWQSSVARVTSDNENRKDSSLDG